MVNEYKRIVLLKGLVPISDDYFSLFKSLMARDLGLNRKKQKQCTRDQIADRMEDKFPDDAGLDKLIKFCKDLSGLRTRARILKKERSKVMGEASLEINRQEAGPAMPTSTTSHMLKSERGETSTAHAETSTAHAETSTTQAETSTTQETSTAHAETSTAHAETSTAQAETSTTQETSTAQKRKNMSKEKTGVKKTKASMRPDQPPCSKEDTARRQPSIAQVSSSASSNISLAKKPLEGHLDLKMSPGSSTSPSQNAIPGSTATYHSNSSETPRRRTVPREPSEEVGYHHGPKQVMVLKVTEPFTYDTEEDKRMFHATVATETEFFRVKVFDAALRSKFIPRKIIAISDYFGCNGFLEIYRPSCVSDVNVDQTMVISKRLRQRAIATPRISHLFLQTKGTFVNGEFAVIKKTERNNFIYYGIEDDTGKMEVVVYGRLTNINCEPGSKLRLVCFELNSTEDMWQLKSVRHSYMQVPLENPIIASKKTGDERLSSGTGSQRRQQRVQDVHCTVPNPYNLLSILSASRTWYTVLDLKDTFFCLRLHLNSQPLFAFKWRDPESGRTGQLTLTRLPQGFKNSHTLFDEALHWDLATFQTREDCELGTQKILAELGELGYQVSAKKAQLCRTEVTYLGYTLKKWTAVAHKRQKTDSHTNPNPNHALPDPVASGWLSCLRVIAATATLIKDADKLTLVQKMTVVAPHALESIIRQPPDHWITNDRMTHYQSLLLTERVTFAPPAILNPTTLLPEVDETPVHQCEEILAEETGTWSDLTNRPWPGMVNEYKRIVLLKGLIPISDNYFSIFKSLMARDLGLNRKKQKQCTRDEIADMMEDKFPDDAGLDKLIKFCEDLSGLRTRAGILKKERSKVMGEASLEINRQEAGPAMPTSTTSHMLKSERGETSTAHAETSTAHAETSTAQAETSTTQETSTAQKRKNMSKEKTGVKKTKASMRPVQPPYSKEDTDRRQPSIAQGSSSASSNISLAKKNTIIKKHSIIKTKGPLSLEKHQSVEFSTTNNFPDASEILTFEGFSVIASNSLLSSQKPLETHLDLKMSPGSSTSPSQNFPMFSASDTSMHLNSTVLSTLSSEPLATLTKKAQLIKIPPPATASSTLLTSHATPPTASSSLLAPQLSSETTSRALHAIPGSTATYHSNPSKTPKRRTVPKEPSNEEGHHQGPKQVMVLKVTEPFTYDTEEDKRMFHATVATETEFFRVKVFEAALKSKFIPRNIIEISDYYGCNGFLEIHKQSCVSDVNVDQTMVISKTLRQRAIATPKISHLFSHTKGTFVNGEFAVIKKTERNNSIYYGIEDDTGKMEVVVYGRLTNINCEPGSKLRLVCFELNSTENTWQLKSVKHSYMQPSVFSEASRNSLGLKMSPGSSTSPSQNFPVFSASDTSMHLNSTVPSTLSSEPLATLTKKAQLIKIPPPATASSILLASHATPPTASSSLLTPQLSSATTSRALHAIPGSTATYHSNPSKTPRRGTVPKESSKEAGHHQGPKQVMVLKVTEPFTYGMKEDRRMFHATVATETEFFRVKVFDAALRSKFIPRKIIAISDYFGRNGFLEIYKPSCVSDVNVDQTMVISKTLRERAIATPKISHPFLETKGTFVNGEFAVIKKTERNNLIYYEIEDDTGKMEVVVYGRLTNINCEPGSKVRLVCFELNSTKNTWQLKSIRHSYMQVINARR
uniref:uncharacterized protein LOC117721372 n=1 Tax=Arvicanthis niloticus TaxID=61156 RepID=UPI00402B53CD